jgi:hypothetical protein
MTCALIVAIAPPLLSQGVIPVNAAAALTPPSGNKTAVSDDSVLNIAYLDGGAVMVSRSVGGGAWDAPVAVSAGIVKPTHPVIAAGSDGTVAVAFISGTALYYTYLPRGGAWSKPVQPLPGEFVTDVAMAASGTTVHLALNTSEVDYSSFPPSH